MTDYSHINVLVVDDEKTVREVLTTFLRDYGFSAESCGSTEEARDLIMETFYHVCVVDISLPGFSGEDLIRLASRRFPKQRYIIHTGDHAYKLPSGLRALGITPEHVFQKPITALPLLVQHIKTLVSEATHEGASGGNGLQ